MDPEPVDPKDDPRSVDDLFNAALAETGEAAWDAVTALHRRGTREVLDRALSLCRSLRPLEREVGAWVLGRLGAQDRAFPDEMLDALVQMLEVEAEDEPLKSILNALGHQARPAAVAAAARRGHHDPMVRCAVVQALTGLSEPRAIACLIELSRDPDAGVRIYAAFALGEPIDQASPAICEALTARLDDEVEDIRSVAIAGLASRGDRRAPPALRAELASRRPSILDVETAASLAEPELHPLLVALREVWHADPKALDEAIRACTPA